MGCQLKVMDSRLGGAFTVHTYSTLIKLYFYYEEEFKIYYDKRLFRK